MNDKVYQRIASLLVARANCATSGNHEWLDRHTEELTRIVADRMPSGSGFDNGTTLDLDASTPNKLVFDTTFHHMDDNGMYTEWTEHRVIVRPSLWSGFDLHITGRNRNDIKDYIGDTFQHALDQTISA